MTDIKINQKLIVPLFNAEFDKPLQITLTGEEFVDRLTVFLFPEPIPLIPLQGRVKKQEGNEPIPTPVPTPRTTIHFFPWEGIQTAKNGISSLLPLQHLPPDFDVFDNLGPFAFRAGPGGLGGFQTLTTAYTKLCAKALLVIEFDQVYPEKIQGMVGSSNPYESTLTESLLDGLRLFSGNEPHQHKGFHMNNNQFVDLVIKWPLMEIQGPPVKLAPADIENLKNTFLQVWQIRSNARKSKTCRIINLALENYYLSFAMTETRTIFLHLMIAFEALFKAKDEGSASAASSRLAKLLGETKGQYNKIQRFMWNTKGDPGCCQVRNQIVHGGTSALSSSMYWQLRSLIRSAILKATHLVLSSQIDREQYYESLDQYINNRFKGLPNN
jgi:hypothetical protein